MFYACAFVTNLFIYRLTEWNDNALLKEKFGNGIPDVADLAKNVSLILVNTHFSFIGSRPLNAQVVEIGGVHIKDPKPLKPVSNIQLFFFLNPHRNLIFFFF